MKKSHKFDEMSDVNCSRPGCDKKLKARIVAMKPTAHCCFGHHGLKEESNGHIMQHIIPKVMHRPTTKRLHSVHA